MPQALRHAERDLRAGLRTHNSGYTAHSGSLARSSRDVPRCSGLNILRGRD